MTDQGMSIDEFPSGTGGDNARRDGYGRYLIVPPTGGKPTGYTRVTTVAGTLESGGALAPWKASMTASGIIMRRGLRAQWEALLAVHGDPWYASEGAKLQCKKLVEECSAVGGANDRKEMGSSLHTITALVDLGRTPTHLTEETERDIQSYIEGRQRAGIEIPEGAVELTVVLDDYQVAGTFDRLAIVPGFDLPLIADLKTGADLSYSWQSIAVQLAGYSRANAVYRQGPARDGSEDQRLPMPTVDQSVGLIFWLPPGGDLELFVVDLNMGWEAFQKSLWAREWRKTQPATRLDRYVHPQTDLEPILQQSIEKAEQDKQQKIERAHALLDEHADKYWKVKPPEPVAEAPAPPAADQLRAKTRQWLQQRIDAIGAHAGARRDLGQRWSELGIPTLKASQDHTPEQLGQIGKLLSLVEKNWELPFPDTDDPGKEDTTVNQIVSMFPGTTITNTTNNNH